VFLLPSVAAPGFRQKVPAELRESKEPTEKIQESIEESQRKLDLACPRQSARDFL